MPRRLGDDPLARARDETAKASPQTTLAAAASYNQVFFQRRGEAESPQQAAGEPTPHEAPEITEISQIPEIREAAAAPPALPLRAEAAREATPANEVAAPSTLSTNEEAVAAEPKEASLAAQVAQAEVVVEGAEPAGISRPAQPPSDAAAGPEPRKNGGGFFKRLLGKLK